MKKVHVYRCKSYKSSSSSSNINRVAGGNLVTTKKMVSTTKNIGKPVLRYNARSNYSRTPNIVKISRIVENCDYSNYGANNQSLPLEITEDKVYNLGMQYPQAGKIYVVEQNQNAQISSTKQSSGKKNSKETTRLKHGKVINDNAIQFENFSNFSYCPCYQCQYLFNEYRPQFCYCGVYGNCPEFNYNGNMFMDGYNLIPYQPIPIKFIQKKKKKKQGESLTSTKKKKISVSNIQKDTDIKSMENVMLNPVEVLDTQKSYVMSKTDRIATGKDYIIGEPRVVKRVAFYDEKNNKQILTGPANMNYIEMHNKGGFQKETQEMQTNNVNENIQAYQNINNNAQINIESNYIQNAENRPIDYKYTQEEVQNSEENQEEVEEHGHEEKRLSRELEQQIEQKNMYKEYIEEKKKEQEQLNNGNMQIVQNNANMDPQNVNENYQVEDNNYQPNDPYQLKIQNQQENPEFMTEKQEENIEMTNQINYNEYQNQEQINAQPYQKKKPIAECAPEILEMQENNEQVNEVEGNRIQQNMQDDNENQINQEPNEEGGADEQQEQQEIPDEHQEAEYEGQENAMQEANEGQPEENAEEYPNYPSKEVVEQQQRYYVDNQMQVNNYQQNQPNFQQNYINRNEEMENQYNENIQEDQYNQQENQNIQGQEEFEIKAVENNNQYPSSQVYMNCPGQILDNKNFYETKDYKRKNKSYYCARYHNSKATTTKNIPSTNTYQKNTYSEMSTTSYHTIPNAEPKRVRRINRYKNQQIVNTSKTVTTVTQSTINEKRSKTVRPKNYNRVYQSNAITTIVDTNPQILTTKKFYHSRYVNSGRRNYSENKEVTNYFSNSTKSADTRKITYKTRSGNRNANRNNISNTVIIESHASSAFRDIPKSTKNSRIEKKYKVTRKYHSNFEPANQIRNYQIYESSNLIQENKNLPQKNSAADKYLKFQEAMMVNRLQKPLEKNAELMKYETYETQQFKGISDEEDNVPENFQVGVRKNTMAELHDKLMEDIENEKKQFECLNSKTTKIKTYTTYSRKGNLPIKESGENYTYLESSDCRNPSKSGYRNVVKHVTKVN